MYMHYCLIYINHDVIFVCNKHSNDFAHNVFVISRQTVAWDRRLWMQSSFLLHWVMCLLRLIFSRQSNFVEIFNPQGNKAIYSAQFSKQNFLLSKNGGHFIFVSISFTVRDRAIFAEIFGPQGQSNVLCPIFKTRFSSFQKWWQFKIFAKNAKTQNCFFLTLRNRAILLNCFSWTMSDRAISLKFSTNR